MRLSLVTTFLSFNLEFLLEFTAFPPEVFFQKRRFSRAGLKSTFGTVPDPNFEMAVRALKI